MRQTHTFAVLEVSESTFREVEGKLRAAEYHHAFSDAAIDMTGIRLQVKPLVNPSEEDMGDGQYAGTQEAMDAAIKEAELNGLEVIYGTPTTLLVDLDDNRLLNTDMLAKLEELFGRATVESWPSQSGTGKHVRVTWAVHEDGLLELSDALLPPNFSPAEAMVLEMALGSDPLRAVLGVRRLQNGVEQPRMLFRAKDTVVDTTDDTQKTTDDDLPF